MAGTVYLLGAGPGDPGLLTVKAEKILRSAEVVVYDRLISEAIMELIPAEAEMIDVGKNVGDHPVPQERINEILAEQAELGHDVVRLKGGDSFLFGRGGEELELLVERGIKFEVVPGITSAIAAAAYAGIPVTHRDYCSSVHIITGHKKKDGQLVLDYDALVRLNGTLVFLMSVSSIGQIAEGLIAAGMPTDMDCAIIENGTRSYQRKLISTIGEVGSAIISEKIKSPALIVVGRVCGLSAKLDWFSKLPLKGKRILVTRPKAGANKLADKLRAAGADVTALPAIKTSPIEFVLPDLDDYTYLVLTSAAGVDAYFAKLFAQADARALSGKKFAVVGKETAKALLGYGIKADFVPSRFSGEDLAKEMLAAKAIGKEDKLLILRAKVASPQLTDILAAAGIAFDEVAIYETTFEENGEINAADYDLVTFTSASCVEGFAHAAAAADLSKINAVCIGRQTADAAAQHQMQIAVAEQATIDSMVEIIIDICR